MDLLVGLLLLLPYLTIVIGIHEAGHFYFARRFGMKVSEYFIGFGPWKIWSRRKGELEYGVKALLGGGYVKIAGMNPYETVPEDDVPRAYFSKPVWQRLIVILAGPLSHFLVAGLVFGGLLFVVGDGETTAKVTEVSRTLADGSISPAFRAGIQAGDVIVRAGDVSDPNQSEFGDAIEASVGEPMTFTVRRGDELFDVTMTPVIDCVWGEWGGVAGIELDARDPGGPAVVRSVVEELPDGSVSPASAAGIRPGDVIVQLGDLADPAAEAAASYIAEHEGRVLDLELMRDGSRISSRLTPVRGCIGGQLGARTGVVLGPVPRPIHEALVLGFREVYRAGKESVASFGKIFGPEGITRVVKLVFTDEVRVDTDPQSVVGIGQFVGSTGGEGEWATVLYVFAYITVFVGLVNLIPLPPFDGGHVLMLAIEKIKGRAVDLRRVIPVAVAVMAFLITFFVATVIADVTKPLPAP